MEQALQEILAKLNKIEQTNDRMEKKLDYLQDELAKQKNENRELKEKLRQNEEKTEKQEERIKILERQLREKRIVIYGIEEMENETDEMRKESFKKIMNKIGIQTNVINDIKQINRIGNKENRSRYNRPLLIELDTIQKRVEIFKEAKKLKGTNIYIAEDYSKQVQETRKRLLPQLKAARENGHRAHMAYDKLIIDGEERKVSEEKEDKKEEKKGRLTSQRSPDGEEEQDNNRKFTKTRTIYPKN